MNLWTACLLYKDYFALNLLLMKRVFTLLIMIGSIVIVYAQTPSTGFDVNKLTGNIMSKLNPSLALTKDQSTQVTAAVNGFLTNKSKIISLQQANNTAYIQKQNSLF